MGALISLLAAKIITVAAGGAVSSFVANVIGVVIGSYVSGQEAKKEQERATEEASKAQGILLNKAANDAPIPVIYGQRKVGGTRVFMEATGSDNEYLHIVLAVSEGEVNSFENVYLNDVLSTDSRFSGLLNVYTHTGSDTQSADSNLVSAVTNWTSDHRLKGTAYIYTKLKYDQDAYPNGLPTITTDLKGVKVFDPRDSSTAWSDNPILCIRDYLTNTRYGRGIATSLIDDTSFNAAANYCEENVTIGGASKARYTCNGVVDTSAGSMDVLKKLLTSCRGFLIFSGGKYKLIIDKAETANFTFSADNIIGAWSISLGNKNNQFNRIKANFFNTNRSWQNDIAVVDSSTLRTQDNGLLLEKTIELPFTSDIDRAKMITTININQSRQQILVEFNATIEALRNEVGDVVYIKHATTGWEYLNASAGKKFRIMRLNLQNNDEVRVMALEYDERAFDFGTINVSDTAPNTNLPDTSVASVPQSLTVSEELYVTNTSQGAQVRANLSWTAPADAFIRAYEVEYQKDSEGYIFLTKTSRTSAPVNNLSAGTFSFRVRAVNTRGVRSAYTTVTQVLAGLTTPPTLITNFSVLAIDGSAHLRWDRSTDQDVLHGGYLRIRHSTVTSGASWDGGADIGMALAGTSTSAVLPLLAGTYMIKAVDSAGNFADNVASAVTTVPNILDFNVVSTVTESPSFSGAKDDVIVVGNVLRLDSNESDGIYSFSATSDLGATYTSRVSANMVASGYEVSDLVDSRLSLVDSWTNWDGEPSEKVSAALQIRTTTDNPSGTPTWSTWQPFVLGDFNARAFQFRVVLTSADFARNIDVSTLVVTIDMPDRNERAQSTTVTTAGVTITYTNAFKDTPTVGITGNDMATGDYWTITNQTASGFTINFYNSASTAIQRNMNWMATGYGRAA